MCWALVVREARGGVAGALASGRSGSDGKGLRASVTTFSAMGAVGTRDNPAGRFREGGISSQVTPVCLSFVSCKTWLRKQPCEQGYYGD